jgi:hypothetical protein
MVPARKSVLDKSGSSMARIIKCTIRMVNRANEAA